MPNNYIGEWFGRRLFPNVRVGKDDIAHIESGQCPFLSEAFGRNVECQKPANSHGVCTITTTRPTQADWIVCPYRALDPSGLKPIVDRIFNEGVSSLIEIFPASSLLDNEPLHQLKVDSGAKKYVLFVEKSGGELSIPKTQKSPELSFDATIFEVEVHGDKIYMGEFGLFEIQTMDFHGSYRHAVQALKNAVNLHAEKFPTTLKDNIEWAGRNIEGPNIANVFKRTFYQIVLKFELAGHDKCAGVVLGLPEAVWESWSHHLALPKIVDAHSIKKLANATIEDSSKSWIVTLRTQASTDAIDKLEIMDFINVWPSDLLKRAFDDVSEHVAATVLPNFRARAAQRLQQILRERARVEEK